MTEVSSAQRHKLKSFIKELKDFKGRGTELVSVYVPAGYDMNKINSHLYEEQGTASNIKSKQTRDNVIAALEKMIQHLKLYSKTPPNGLALFAGNVATREGQQDYQVWSIEPPVPLKQRLYRCDKEFVLDPLIDMTEEKNVYGMVVMDKREGNIALLKGKTIIPLTSSTSAVPGKTRAGGQCLRNSSLVQSDCGQIVEIEKGLKQPVISVGDLTTKRDFTDVRDMVRGYWLALEKCEPGEAYNICSGKAFEMSQVLEMLLKHSTVKIEVKQDPERLRPSDVPILQGDNSKFCSLTGWKPVISFDQTLKDILEFWRERL